MSESPKPLLLSLKPRYADLIFEGVKKAELRRRALVQMEGRDVFVYVTSPIMQLRGGFRVGEVWTGTPQDIWKKVSEWAGVNKDDFDAYYAGQPVAYALEITDVWEFANPPGLSMLRSRFDNFIVPQSWRYVKPEEHQSFRKMERAIETENCGREPDGTGREQAPPRVLYSNPGESLVSIKASATAPRIGLSGPRESPVGGSPGKGGHCATLGDAGRPASPLGSCRADLV